jgi:Co/Zn/Cd efflux system component
MVVSMGVAVMGAIVSSHPHAHDHDHPRGLRAAAKQIFVPHSHDASDSYDSALESSASGIRAVKISLVALGITALAQVAIVIISGSVALAADTIHNFSDALTAIPGSRSP